MQRKKTYFEELLLNIIEFLPDATFVIDRDKRVIAWNRAVEEMTGVPKEDVLGKGDYAYAVPFYGKARPVLVDFVFPDAAALLEENRCSYRYLEKKGDTVYGETFVPLLNGGRGAVLWGKASPLYDGSGNLVGAIESLRDITEWRRAEEALRESEALYRTIFENTGTATIIIEEDTTIALVNEEFEKASGYAREEVEGKKSWTEFFTAEHLEKMLEYHRLRRIDPAAAPGNYESRFVDRYGRVRDVSITVAMIPGTGKSVASLTDITGLKQAGEALARYRLLSENARDIILFVRPDGRIIEANRAALAAYGYSREELLALRIHDLREPGEEALITAQMQQADETGILFETVHRRKDGTTFPVEVSSRGTVLNGERVLLSVVRDITERKKVEKQLQHLATHDFLTNIPNRQFLEEALERAVARARRGIGSALLLLDLDNFKLVNDTLGHAAGDEMLITLTGIFKNNLREGDLLARLGGDEFAVLLEGITAGEAGTVAEKLRRKVEESELCLVMHRSCFNLTVSIGVVTVDGSVGPQKLLSLADNALYAAKEGGRNRIAFARLDEDVTARLSEMNELVGLIRSALRHDRFRLFCQPVYCAGDGRAAHYEVLLRLWDESCRAVPPHRFIPVAERFGLMSQVDLWVFQASLKALAEHPGLVLFINLSGATLGEEKLLGFIEEKVRKSGIDPARLGFEITETTAVKDLLRAERWIRRLRGIGCRFALDDFGIGFSSFSYLRVLPVDYLKIDGSYVRDMDTDPTHRALVQAMNAVAHTLGKKTVAEFVESEGVLKILKEMQVDYVQGYHLGKPAPLF
ncbi:MAG: EAL domain-containing protein [Peptococcaceae bacterium]|nr:EAL domain-containing protein [Peptococcaceae bacterium]